MSKAMQAELEALREFVRNHVAQPGRNIYPQDLSLEAPIGPLRATTIVEARRLLRLDLSTGEEPGTVQTQRSKAAERMEVE